MVVDLYIRLSIVCFSISFTIKPLEALTKGSSGFVTIIPTQCMLTYILMFFVQLNCVAIYILCIITIIVTINNEQVSNWYHSSFESF